MDVLSNLKYVKGSRRKPKRVGRGEGSGHGGTAARGMNGQLSRSGAKKRIWFEGGQMPLARRIPKFGFTNIFKKYYQVVNLSSIQKLIDAKKIKPGELNIGLMKNFGLVKNLNNPVKILGDGELKAKLTIEANAFSKSAVSKIEAAGGAVKKI